MITFFRERRADEGSGGGTTPRVRVDQVRLISIEPLASPPPEPRPLIPAPPSPPRLEDNGRPSGDPTVEQGALSVEWPRVGEPVRKVRLRNITLFHDNVTKLSNINVEGESKRDRPSPIDADIEGGFTIGFI